MKNTGIYRVGSGVAVVWEAAAAVRVR